MSKQAAIIVNGEKRVSLNPYYVCCIYWNALQKIFTVEANTMDPDQTAP